MGVPKTKWSPQEEAALVSGVKKYGIGKWRLIQKDPELGAVLAARSNVDLKDKWRNMHPSAESDAALAKAYPTPTKAKTAPKASGGRAGASHAAAAHGGAGHGGAGPAHHAPPPHHAPGHDNKQKQYEKKLEDLVFEAVRTLKHAATLEGIAVQIEDKYDVPPGFRKQLAAHLKSLADAGKLVKAKSAFVLPGRGAQAPKGGFDVKMAGYRSKGGGKVPEFLINGKRLTAEEMAEEAARAVREAELAAEAAEAAAREAEAAEKEASEMERAAAAQAAR